MKLNQSRAQCLMPHSKLYSLASSLFNAHKKGSIFFLTCSNPSESWATCLSVPGAYQIQLLCLYKKRWAMSMSVHNSLLCLWSMDGNPRGPFWRAVTSESLVLLTHSAEHLPIAAKNASSQCNPCYCPVKTKVSYSMLTITPPLLFRLGWKNNWAVFGHWTFIRVANTRATT